MRLGLTWSVAAMLLQRNKFIKEWGGIALGLSASLLVFTLALLMVADSTGLFARPGLSRRDHALTAQVTQDNGAEKTTPNAVPQTTKPTQLVLPSVNISLPIDDATIDIDTNNWPLSESEIHYANFTPEIGAERGTMLLYGHNTWPLLRGTGSLQIGDEMILVDEKDAKWTFVLSQQRTIIPEETAFIYEDVPFRIVMFTCDGWSDQYRRLMYFQPVNQS